MANSRPIHRLRKNLHTVPSHRLRQQRDHHSEASSANPGRFVTVSLKDDTRKEWIKKVRFGLNHPHRMKATSELTDVEKPQPCLKFDDQFQKAYSAIRSIHRATHQR